MARPSLTLSQLSSNESATIEAVHSGPAGLGLVARLAALGMVENQSVQVLRKALMGGPLHVLVGATTEVVIRRREAAAIWVRLP